MRAVRCSFCSQILQASNDALLRTQFGEHVDDSHSYAGLSDDQINVFVARESYDLKGGMTKAYLVAICALCVASAAGSYWIWKYDTQEDFYFWFMLLCPVIFGLWFGFTWPGSHLKGYSIAGLLVGLIEMAAIIYIWKDHFIFSMDNGMRLPRGSSKVFWQVALGAMLLFASGGLFADFVEFTTRRLNALSLNDSPSMSKLISVLGPSFITALGAVIAAVVGIISLSFSQEF